MGFASSCSRREQHAKRGRERAQLADFLKGAMEKAGGLMPVPDVYCLFNRARGTELVSPDDLLAAIKLFPQIRVPFSLRQFGNGVLVVQSASHSDEQACSF